MIIEQQIKEICINKGEVRVIEEGGVLTPKGYMAGGLHCGIKKKNLDIGWIYSVVPASAAAVYTLNAFQAAPITVTKNSIDADQRIQGVLVNSGVANAVTGDRGLVDAYAMRKLFSDKMGCLEHHVAIASTGVIGTHLPMEKIKSGVDEIDSFTGGSENKNFEKAILTTDTCMKHIAVQMLINGKVVSIGGAAKGSGMIKPNMATMLGFITTDANIPHEHLQQALKSITDHSFNMITVDGDTSTNDMVLVLANGVAQNDALHPLHPDWDVFIDGLTYLCQDLAKKIAKDGEGATKLVEVHVLGSDNEEAAQAIAKTIVGSSLVKTAIYGADANWGRIVCAVGYSGQPVDPQSVTVSLGTIKVVNEGLPCSFDEAEAKAYLEQNFVKIVVELNQGNASAIAWGCDLTYDYVRINASYRT